MESVPIGMVFPSDHVTQERKGVIELYKNKYDLMTNQKLADEYHELIGHPVLDNSKVDEYCRELRLCEIAIIRRFLDDLHFCWEKELESPFEKRCELYATNFGYSPLEEKE